jgi:gliding motility-associated-like protein
VTGTFTQDDVDNNRVTYLHDGSEATADAFTFDVTDAGGAGEAAQTFSITINPVNDDPVLAVNTALTLNEGTTAAITAAQLQINDADHTVWQLTYTVTALPANGTLLVSNSELSVNGTFTQDDINNTRVTYRHDGSETSSDGFTFSITDAEGAGETGQYFAITILTEGDAIVFIPSLFTPDGNGTNDMFRVRGAGIVEIRFKIYNAFGTEVFSTADVTTAMGTGWDGRHRGQEQPPGAYTWTLSGKFANGQTLTVNGKQHGQVLLMR